MKDYGKESSSTLLEYPSCICIKLYTMMGFVDIRITLIIVQFLQLGNDNPAPWLEGAQQSLHVIPGNGYTTAGI